MTASQPREHTTESAGGEARKEEVRQVMSPWFAQPFAGFYPPYGWLDLVQEIHTHLIAVAPGYRITQVKEKFGTLCYYVDHRTLPANVREACHNFIREKERESYGICQNCGQGGASLRQSGWVATQCDCCAAQEDARGYPSCR